MQAVNQMAEVQKKDALQRLKVLIDSSTPIVVIETVEEVRAVRMVRAACSALNLAAFEWSVATGLMRCGSSVGEVVTGGNMTSRPTVFRIRRRMPRLYTTAANLPRCWPTWKASRLKQRSS